MILSNDLYSVISRIANNDNTENERKALSSLLSTYRSNNSFLYVDINDKDDYISFIPNKKSILENVNFMFKNPCIFVEHNSTIDVLKIIDKKKLSSSVNPSHTYKLLGEYGASDDYDNYTILHFLNTINGEEVLHLQHKYDRPGFVIDLDSIKDIKKSEMKFGRFIKNLAINDLLRERVYFSIRKFKLIKPLDKEIERLSNLFKSANFFSRNINKYISVVEGEDIRKWYLHKNYADENTDSLQNSCMRYSGCQEFFDIYINNGVKMLILKNENGKLIGRALLWDKTSLGKYMDRVYGLQYISDVFTSWGKEHGYEYFHNTIDHNIDISVDVKIDLSKDFPYLDTFRYMITTNDDDGLQNAKLKRKESNHTCDELDNSKKVIYYMLNSTEGSYNKSNEPN